MKRMVSLLAALCLFLTGCSWMDGNFYDVTPHKEQIQSSDTGEISAANYYQLCQALRDMVDGGKERGIIYVPEYNSGTVEDGILNAVGYICNETALGAYAVEEILYEVGTNSGRPAISVEIRYLHSRSEIRQIQEMADMAEVTRAIYDGLENCQASLVLHVEAYEPRDMEQLVEDYAAAYPELIMEVPQVTVGIYPDSGNERILEVKFIYQNSRDTLRQMQTQVASLFEAAELYVSGDGSDYLKLSRLYGFITGLGFDIQLDTSITPAYSLLRHGVGDSKAVAGVYAALCRRAGLECQVVTGTRNGEARCWNLVKDGDRYYHVDLLRCWELGSFREFTDRQMNGYVWDYSAYPECPEVPTVAPETEPTEESTAETEPDPTEDTTEEVTEETAEEVTEEATQPGEILPTEESSENN